jgi:hypothetical protein
LFPAGRLAAPWALCPATTDADAVREWLPWGTVGMEGGHKRLDLAYEAGVRGWLEYWVREMTEAIADAVTGPAGSPHGWLLSRYDDQQRLQRLGRTATLARATGNTIGGHLTPGERGHRWTGWDVLRRVGHPRDADSSRSCSPSWSSRIGVGVARNARRPLAPPCTARPATPPPTSLMAKPP